MKQCQRCGYYEFEGSLHIHHINRDRDNNNESNLILLCANCHFGLHQKKWKLEEIGIRGQKLVKRKRGYCYKKASWKEMVQEIKMLKYELSQLTNQFDKKQRQWQILKYIRTMKILGIYDLIKFDYYELYDRILLYEKLFEAELYNLKNKNNGRQWIDANLEYPDKEMMAIIKKRIKLIHKHINNI